MLKQSRGWLAGRDLFAPNALDCGAAPSSCTTAVHSAGRSLVLRINHRKSLRPEKILFVSDVGISILFDIGKRQSFIAASSGLVSS